MSVKIITGDCRAVLANLPDQSVHCCVTSPPYFGLRDYGNAAQIGLEPTPDEFVAAMVEVFREVRRVLRDDGTLWLNLGDSYAGSWGNYGGQNRGKPGGQREIISGSAAQSKAYEGKEKWRPATSNKMAGIKNKDLIGIPWRVAFALQSDGWYLRQDIIWSKPNPMPESVQDRCTKAHEYLFLLSKSGRYYFDNKAISEPVALSTIDRLSQPNLENQAGSDRVPGKTNGPMKAVGHLPGNKTHKGVTAYEAGDERHRTKAGLVDYATKKRSARDSFKREGSKREQVIPGQSVGTHRPDREESQYDLGTRNKRSVWTVATMPFKEAHFATFPPALIEPCVLAGCPLGGTVLDPFGGAGTTGLVADRLGRDAILIELNPEYAAIAEKRLHKDAGMFAQVDK